MEIENNNIIREGDIAASPDTANSRRTVLSETHLQTTYKPGRTNVTVNSLFNGDIPFASVLLNVIRHKVDRSHKNVEFSDEPAYNSKEQNNSAHVVS